MFSTIDYVEEPLGENWLRLVQLEIKQGLTLKTFSTLLQIPPCLLRLKARLSLEEFSVVRLSSYLLRFKQSLSLKEYSRSFWYCHIFYGFLQPSYGSLCSIWGNEQGLSLETFTKYPTITSNILGFFRTFFEHMWILRKFLRTFLELWESLKGLVRDLRTVRESE
jgi:hypothetical protein